MIRAGIGGWVFEPWRGTFFPKGLRQASELEYASRKLTTIEINGTFYRTQKPDTFRKWADETPDDFVFSLKGPQFATNRRVLAEAGPSIERFFTSGVLELKSKLGPMLWQMAPTKKFDPEDFAAFLALLPPQLDGRPIRHAVEVRHESFLDAAFIELLRKHLGGAGAGRVRQASDDCRRHERFRLSAAAGDGREGSRPATRRRRSMPGRSGRKPGRPAARRPISPPSRGKPPKKPRDVFVYMISGAKVRAPAAAMALLERLNGA